ncbi:MAG: zinc-ribbon domain containing protein [Prevotella sp.]|nr:zinc-ribbon domain containing protein [Alistipes senegalensis]MCM1357305.1 zinc-ribbon domain containing protein [Prevotella sp.]
MKIICKQCNKAFKLTNSEIKFYKDKNLDIPKRCKQCREANNLYGNYPRQRSTRKKHNNSLKYSLLLVFLIIGGLTAVFSYTENIKNKIPDAEISSNQKVTYYLNTYRNKFHRPDCSSVSEMNPQNKEEFYGTREEAISQGYSPCQNCNP